MFPYKISLNMSQNCLLQSQNTQYFHNCFCTFLPSNWIHNVSHETVQSIDCCFYRELILHGKQQQWEKITSMGKHFLRKGNVFDISLKGYCVLFRFRIKQPDFKKCTLLKLSEQSFKILKVWCFQCTYLHMHRKFDLFKLQLLRLCRITWVQ